MSINDYDENGVHYHTNMIMELAGRIRLAKVAFNIPVGYSARSDDDDYLAEVGRMTLEALNKEQRVDLGIGL